MMIGSRRENECSVISISTNEDGTSKSMVTEMQAHAC